MKRKYFYLAVMLTGMSLTSCEDIWNHCVDGNGNRDADIRMLDSFEEIQINGDFEINIDTGQVTSARVEADENLMDFIVTHVTGKRLIIESRNGNCIRPSQPIEIKVTVPFVSVIHLNGSGSVDCYGLKTDELEVRISGSGQITCNEVECNTASYELEGSGSIISNLVTENVSAQLEGSGEIRMSGLSLNSDFKIIGSGRIKADQIITNVCVAYISGSGIIETYVNNALDVTIIGSGIVYYEGNPVVESNISGSGKVIKQ
jgi:hypothetical protein